MVAPVAPRVTMPTPEQKAADLTERVELVGRAVKQGVAVWWVPSWSGAADEHGDPFHIVLRVGVLEVGGAPWWWCDCPHGEHHPGAAACSHVRAVQLWIERREGQR